MSGKVYLICGKICSGKSCYAEKLRKEKNAVVLSVDEITLSLFGQHLGGRHEEICEKTQDYLFRKSLEITEAGCDVILDWGFWQKEKRMSAREFYKKRNISCELHYIDVSDEDLRKNISERNKTVSEHKDAAYFVDENLAEKCESLFEIPDRTETEVWYKNERKKNGI